MHNGGMIEEVKKQDILIEEWLQTMRDNATHDSFKDEHFLGMLKSAIYGFLIFTAIKGFKLTKEEDRNEIR